METQVILPALGMAQETGIIVRWLKSEGQNVTKGEPLVEIETDKATVEVGATASGILTKVTGTVGVEIPVGQVIASIIDSEAAVQENTQVKGGTAYSNTISDGHAPPLPGDSLPHVTASPLAARIAAEHNLDLETIKPSGKRIQSSDVLAHIQDRQTTEPMISIQPRLVAASPQVDTAKALFEKQGIKTASYQVYPAETTDYNPIADKIIASGAQVVVVGTLLPDVSAFIQRFKQQHYNPQALIATAGPDQGDQFTKAIGGTKSAEAIMVPNGGWFAQANTPGNSQMVQEYLAKYGGTADGISSDVAEGYSVGQVLQQAIAKVGSLDNQKIIAELHSGDTFTTVQGPVKFDSTGQNTAATAYLFQWQNGSLVPVYPTNVATTKPEYPRPNWP